MTRQAASLTAILGPTNTGKTHLAVERMCGHSSGIIGFPLRLLAREVYDRVVALKGAEHVALITGEEKIIPATARYFLCTAESMPVDRDVSFLALDEAQMGMDDERGHVFTQRMLHARGRDETMILGSAALAPLVRLLLPQAEIISRPRFSTLSYAAPKKLSRLPKRAAIVCFSTEEVYAIAEIIRRQRGGAAVVMGSLSPRTRNAQVAMFQSGEVEYLVATDAIGMGLNMDISHIAFASLSKFDDKRRRRLTLMEMGQIAGRAGRHQRDGSFGVVQLSDSYSVRGFEAEEVLALEAHELPPLTELKWRNSDMDFSGTDAMIAGLEQRPQRGGLARSDETIDLAVLKRLALEPKVIARSHDTQLIRRLWACCQLPDYRKTGAEQHSHLVSKLFSHLSSGKRTVPVDWMAAEVSRLDSISGDIDTLAGRIAAIRTWTYVAHQADWLEAPQEWAMRTRALEDRLSDALHEKLTQRFVDRRSSALMRDLNHHGDLTVRVAADGAVEVEGEAIGKLEGFTFTVDHTTTHSDKRMAMAAAERALGGELQRRAQALSDEQAQGITLQFAPPVPPAIAWNGEVVAHFKPGKSLLEPHIILSSGAIKLADLSRDKVAAKLQAWFHTQLAQVLRPLEQLSLLADKLPAQGGISGAARGLAVQIIDHGGCMRRAALDALIADITAQDRAALRQAGLRLGMVHVFAPAALKPEAARWRLALWSIGKAQTAHVPDILWSGRTSLDVDSAINRDLYAVAGYWIAGQKAVRIDMVERLADAVREQGKTRAAFVPQDQAISMLGLSREAFAGVMGALGYRQRQIASTAAAIDSPPPPAAFIWKGRARPAQKPDRQATPKVFDTSSPFAALLQWKAGGA
jgi:ATP-dependent RNA helicase SUPV3L1/SUV3